ncbi:hypothetical protein [Oceanobacillus piezotolerans]|nr:hypothetical protein [Oceanobacillus piezotolerans]
MKKIYLTSVGFMIFALVACSNSNESNPEQDDASNENLKKLI